MGQDRIRDLHYQERILPPFLTLFVICMGLGVQSNLVALVVFVSLLVIHVTM